MTKDINTNEIVVNDKKFTHSETNINNMVESISMNGMLNPLLVTEKNVLVSGRCRLEASKRLNLESIECKVVFGTEDELRLMTIEENLIRKNLSVFEQEVLIYEKTLLLKKMKMKGATKIISDETGDSVRTIQRNNKTMNKIHDVPDLFKKVSFIDSEDNFTKDEIETISNDEDIQKGILDGSITKTSQVREKKVQKKGIEFRDFDLDEIKDFFNDKVQEMNKLIDNDDRDKLTVILTQINSYYTKSLINPTEEGK